MKNESRARSAQITIHADRPLHEISPWIYGQFLEHINYSLDLGIHAELLTERSFEIASSEIPPSFAMSAHSRSGERRGGLDLDFPAFQWSSTLPAPDPLAYRERCDPPLASLTFTLIGKSAKAAQEVVEGQLGIRRGEADAEGAPNGERYLRMKIPADLATPQGFRQEFIPARAGEELDGFIFLRAPEGGGAVEIGLRKLGGGPSYARTTISKIGSKWTKASFRLKPEETDLDAEFYVIAERAGVYDFDLVSLMPVAKRNSSAPFRDDLVAACARLKPSIIRWPGGCFVEIYDWKKGIGPYDQRQPIHSFDWGHGGETEPSTFGTDEFISFCRLVGAEPLIVFNVLAGVQDAMDWIEYCNGPITSPWGAKRAANGHPEPYDVTCWSVDNERWALGYDPYCSLANEVMDAIRAKYPDFKLWTVGTGQPLEAPANPDSRSNWGPEVIRRTGDRSDFSSFHNYYNNGLAGNLSIEEDFRREAAAFREAVPGKNIQISYDEWMGPKPPYLLGALQAALMFNSLERCGDIVGMAAPAPWLWHQRLGTAWADTLIHHDHRGWFPTPVYLANELWANHRAPTLLSIEFDGPHLHLDVAVRDATNQRITETREIPALDIATTVDAQDGRIVLKVVNREMDHAIRTEIFFEGTTPTRKATAYQIYHSNLDAVNTFTKPDELKIDSRVIERSPEGWIVTFPPHSANVIVFQTKHLAA